VEHVFDPDSLLIVEHIERWEVSAGEGVRQLFTPGPPDGLRQGEVTGAPREVHGQAAGDGGAEPKLDPVIGPAVRLARGLGLMNEEPEGWKGEPLAWAEAGSIPQRLSEFTAQRLGGFKQWAADRAAGNFDVEAVDARLEREVSSPGVVMFSFTSCPFCRKAKAVLDEEGAKYRVIELDIDEDGYPLRARLGRRVGRTSVPAIFINGNFVGGCNDGNPGLLPLRERGELRPLLKAARAIPRV